MTPAVLGIDTAGDRASVALGGPEGLWRADAVEGARRQARDLLPVVARLLEAGAIRARDLAEIVVGDGPGAFTGLRIGWALARALAHERGTPVVAVPSLMGYARSAAIGIAAGAAPVAACYDALRGQVYGAVYGFDGDRVNTLVAPAVVTLEELVARHPGRPAAVVGDGAERYAETVRRWTGAPPARPGSTWPPVAWSLVTLRRAAGRAVTGAADAEPVYGRPAEAQAKWEARHGRSLPDTTR